MKYIESPTVCTDFRRTIFMAGGITNCPDWQKLLRDKLEDDCPDWTLLNPRRENFDVEGGTNLATEQIMWEWQHLRNASIILFWFPRETLCPIVLFELGRWLNSAKPLVVGCDLQYPRRYDVVVQTRLERASLQIQDNLDGMRDELCRIIGHNEWRW